MIKIWLSEAAGPFQCLQRNLPCTINSKEKQALSFLLPGQIPQISADFHRSDRHIAFRLHRLPFRRTYYNQYFKTPIVKPLCVTSDGTCLVLSGYSETIRWLPRNQGTNLSVHSLYFLWPVCTAQSEYKTLSTRLPRFFKLMLEEL